ncbi:hypothetical protein [Pedobacter africanus]|uniref:Uncharacterized protein n=1 Tax=Pedobacter africanus TaxID=151894 RepID=A0A1W2BQT6_9SPHI|nr:hypothetical protein [Pedobacter africanus]SMC75327.1 hypothetical protein SAMN04488524_2568 [Pedobacter africanus]
MNKFLTLFFFGILFTLSAYSQNYDHILNYNLNTTSTYGVKIKTNLPFEPDGGMPTITIKGYNYGTADPISLTLIYYVWRGTPGDPNTYYFSNPIVSSSGAYTPPIYLSNEGGKVVIFIDDRSYFQRLTVSAFGQGDNETLSWFQGWTAADEPLGSTYTVGVPYRNRFAGEVYMPGNSLWKTDGVGIGTGDLRGYKLAVNGKIRAQEIKVEASPWPDYVFAKDYQLPTLQETEKHIKDKGHLPGIPSAAEVKANGIDLGEMNAKLLQKIEELTLHLIEKDTALKLQKETLDEQQLQLKKLQEQINSIVQKLK